MKQVEFKFVDHKNVEIHCNKWYPEQNDNIKAVVQISHGLGEHALRYTHVAESFTQSGYIVYADDHRGHGKTAGKIENLGQIDPDGWPGCIQDLYILNQKIKEENPGLPIFYLGHSWGSVMGQDFIQQHGDEIKGAILTGTFGKQALLGALTIIAKILIKKDGPNAVSPLMAKLSLDPLNKPFAPNRTTHDWLSRDEKVVDAYISDPFCGFNMKNSYWLEFALGLKKIWKKKNEQKIPKDLPILLMTGSNDPVNVQTKTFLTLVERYQKLGIKDLTYKIYDQARHEILNELQKEQVKKDIIDWMDSHLD